MNVTEFKRKLAALSTHATIREKATGPESRIGVQAAGGKIKLIAGTSRTGVTVIAGDTDVTGRVFTIDARPFLTSGKVIKGKLDLQFEVTGSGLGIVTDKGGSLGCQETGTLRESGFVKRPRKLIAQAQIDGPKWAQIGRLFDAVQRDIDIPTPTIDIRADGTDITAVSPVMQELYASLHVNNSQGEAYGAAYVDFFRSLKVLEHSGTLSFCEDGVVASAGDIEIFSGPYRVARYDAKKRTSLPPENPKPLPTLNFRGTPATSFTLERKRLIDVLRGQASNDQDNRVTLVVNDTALEVVSYGAESGFVIPTATSGQGMRSVNAGYLMDILRAFDSKEVTLGWGVSPGIKIDAEGYQGWTILVAPVVLDK